MIMSTILEREETATSKFFVYASPEVIVDTAWVEANLKTPGVRIIESNEDVLLYDIGHITGAVHIDWMRDLQDGLIRDYIDEERFAKLCEKNGIGPETKCVFYGDKSNWWACYAFWVFKLFGHKDCVIMDGGRNKWIAENRAVTRKKPEVTAASYPVPAKRLDGEIRAFFDETDKQSLAEKALIDVRSPAEYRGEVTHMPEYPQEGVLRGGHVPGAKSCPWARAVNEDGSFKTAEALRAIYEGEMGLSGDDEAIVYCRIGERSSHTWFVLTYLLGHKGVRNYDGSWTEWGNRVRSRIERSF